MKIYIIFIFVFLLSCSQKKTKKNVSYKKLEVQFKKTKRQISKLKKQNKIKAPKQNQCIKSNKGFQKSYIDDFVHFHYSSQPYPKTPWKLIKQINIKTRITAYPFILNDKFFIFDHKGRMWVFDYKYHLKKKIKVATDKIWAGAIKITDNDIVVGSDDDYLYFVNTSNFKITKKIKPFNCKKVTGANPEKVRCDIDALPVKYKQGVLVPSKGVAFVDSKGEIIWKFEVSDHIRSSPIVVDDKIYFASLGGKVFSLNSSGKKIWEYQVRNQCDSTLLFFDNCTIIVGCDDNAIHAIDAITGKKKWKLLSDGDFRYGGSLNFSLKRLYYGSMDRYLYAIKPTGRVAWRYKTYGRIMVSPVVDTNDNIYITPEEKRLYILNSEGKLLWYKNLPAIADVPPILLPNNHVLIVTEKGNILIFSSLVSTIMYSKNRVGRPSGVSKKNAVKNHLKNGS